MTALDTHLTTLTKIARTDAQSRQILGDLWEERGRPDVARLWRDQLPEAPRRRKRVDKLSAAESADMAKWAERWIEVGLSTERADRALYEAGVAACYRAANLPCPHVVWCPSPLVAVLAGPIAAQIVYGSAVRGAVHDAVHGAVHGAVGGAVGDAVRDAVGGAVHGAVHGAVGGAVGDAVRDAVGGAVGGAVGDAVRDAVGGAVRDAVGGAVRDAVGGAVRDAVGDAVGDAVRDAVGDAVGDAVRDAVGGAVRDAVGDLSALNESNRGWWRYMGGQFWVGWHYWLSSPSAASFILDRCGLRLDPKTELAARAYAATALSACWWWPGRDFVMVSERPKSIEFHDSARKRLKLAEWQGWKVEQ